MQASSAETSAHYILPQTFQLRICVQTFKKKAADSKLCNELLFLTFCLNKQKDTKKFAKSLLIIDGPHLYKTLYYYHTTCIFPTLWIKILAR